MIYAYIRVSTDRQTVENQRFEILKKTSSDRVHVDQWTEETASGTKNADDRMLGQLLKRMSASLPSRKGMNLGITFPPRSWRLPSVYPPKSNGS